VTENDEPESGKGMLLWALRGAGGGNLGIVVEMKIQVLSLKVTDRFVTAGRYTWYLDLRDDHANLITMMNRF
jgi:FAD/FMN-containing dehydrogenase